MAAIVAGPGALGKRAFHAVDNPVFHEKYSV
jgi:hypothetical protein